MIRYQAEPDLSVEEFVSVLARSGLAERRPVADFERMTEMVRRADLMVTARTEDGTLVGVARCLSDFVYCCYLSDLAVDKACQQQGIGKALIAAVRDHLHKDALLLLLAAPAARDYYGHIGFRAVDNAWCLDRETSLR